MQLYPYIKFNRNCNEAIKAYESIFGAVSSHKQTYGDFANFGGDRVSESDENCIMHCELDFDGVKIMVCDDLKASNENWTLGKYERFNIGITFDSLERQKTVFDNLSKHGTVIVPLSKTHWNAQFGMVIDNFGVTWLLNHNFAS